MSQRILVAYASRAGSTAEVAEVIGQVLRVGEAEVDVRPVTDVHSVVGYDAVVLGSAIWAFKPLPEATRFAANNRDALTSLPVAYFALCETLRDDTPANRDRARRFLDPLRKLREPVAYEPFAGKRDLSEVNLVVRWLLQKLAGVQQGDWRDWEKIRAWASALAPKLTAAEPASARAGQAPDPGDR